MKNKVLVLLGLILATSAYAEVVGPPAPSAVQTGTVVLTKDNTLTINDVFLGPVTAAIVKKAKELDARVESSDPIYLVINSPGGSIDDGLEMIENLSSLKRPVHTVTLFAASMGFQTVQGLGDRLIVKNGTLMSHKARGGFFGEFPGQLDSRYGHYLRRVTRMDEIAVKRTKGKHTLKSYHDLIENEYWCDGQDCIDQGFADKIITISCDKSLEGISSVDLDKFIWSGHTIEIKADYDNCPLNTSPLNLHILVDGQPLFKENKQDQTKKVAENNTYTSFLLGSSFGPSYQEDIASKLTKDELFEINSRVQNIIQRKQKREVVKGY